jgi:hypothetical protein
MWLRPKKKPMSDLLEKLSKLIAKTAEVQAQRTAITGLAMIKSLTGLHPDVIDKHIKEISKEREPK